MTYFERLSDGSIGRTTSFRSIANDNGFLENQTEEQIVYFCGKQYLESEIRFLPNYLETRKSEALSKLKALFSRKSQQERLMSSLGFEVDANETAIANIDGLVLVMEEDGIQKENFCDANNQLHTVSLDEVKTIRKEMKKNRQRLYRKKWAIRNAINGASSSEELDTIPISLD